MAAMLDVNNETIAFILGTEFLCRTILLFLPMNICQRTWMLSRDAAKTIGNWDGDVI